MQHQEGRFQGTGGLELFMQSWHPDGDRRAVVAVIHGLGEHSGRYMNVVNKLVPAGFVVYGFDHRGHGRSPDRHCAHINDWGEYRGDVKAFLAVIRQHEPDLPLFLMGHSMGGLITLNYVLHQPEGLRGVVVSAPALVAPQVALPLRLMGLLLSRLRPETELENGLDVNGLARDTAVVAAYQKDPLVHSKVSARWFTEFQKTIAWTLAHAEEFRPSLLLLHGDADTLVPIAGGRQFFEKVQQPDKQYIVYPGGYHESHNDLHRDQMLADLENWLTSHLP